ncbi:DUF1127 domain-containing protein [Falsirhodobacter sp. 20TX0035]|uniref:DUF1127 domain-containing protein n=1 Tax=Falsirhodobacter sp. 20TX0035 TaxID=3022019 RepID=UPI00232BA40A|nr:DUF1127 domain-containing protein [Falsirhodobacter sp. 20TX0035]MDB6452943.1 DUF1127 domain-containing protein [Falsirhodobacter sp. 20TX0035]
MQIAQLSGFNFSAQGQGFVGNLLTSLRALRQRRAVYVRTANELAALSGRELADIGISRSDIRAIARRAAAEA